MSFHKHLILNLVQTSASNREQQQPPAYCPFVSDALTFYVVSQVLLNSTQKWGSEKVQRVYTRRLKADALLLICSPWICLRLSTGRFLSPLSHTAKQTWGRRSSDVEAKPRGGNIIHTGFGWKHQMSPMKHTFLNNNESEAFCWNNYRLFKTVAAPLWLINTHFESPQEGDEPSLKILILILRLKISASNREQQPPAELEEPETGKKYRKRAWVPLIVQQFGF